MATLVLETIGTQEYQFEPAAAMARLADCYGEAAAQQISNAMGFVSV
jgi:adenosine kinase